MYSFQGDSNEYTQHSYIFMIKVRKNPKIALNIFHAVGRISWRLNLLKIEFELHGKRVISARVIEMLYYTGLIGSVGSAAAFGLEGCGFDPKLCHTDVAIKINLLLYRIHYEQIEM